MNKMWDVIVIGGGQAGLVSGYYLNKKKLRFLILEASNEAVGSWPRYYDSLKLFSPAQLSSMPGLKMPGHRTHYPLRDEVIQYLKNYAKAFDLPIQPNQKVIRIEKSDGFTIHTEAGAVYQTKAIINATGSFHNPFTPNITGREIFKGEVLHSFEYRNPDRYKDQRVLVVGRGNSAVQIAMELTESSHTSLAVLQPVQLVNQKVFGIDLHFWIKAVGLDTFQFWRFGKQAPIPTAAADLGDYKSRLEAGKPDQRDMFVAFTESGVVWPEGLQEKVDTVIFATGYRPSLTYLQEIGALDRKGRPLHKAGISQNVPGLYFVGLEGQRSFASATLRGVGPDAKYVVRHIGRFLQTGLWTGRRRQL